MKTQTHQTHYAEALNIITSLGTTVDGTFDTVRLERTGERWRVLLIGPQSSSMNSMLRLFNASPEPEISVLGGLEECRGYSGRLGRVQVTLMVVQHIIRRTDGVTGLDIPEEGLW